MKKILTLSLLLSGLLSMSSVWGQCSELFISEYLEGSSNNKALELYNPSGASIALTDYKMYRFNNGATSPSDSLFPQGSIDAYGTYTIVNPSGDAAMLAVADTTHTMTFFNGDDAILLIKISNGDTLDAIGVVGIDPGSAWTVGSGETRENTLVRKANVAGGTTDWTFSAANEWDVFPANTFGFLGSHGSLCDPAYVPVYPIDLVTNDADGDGVGDSLGVACELRGVVHGIDIQGGSPVSFTFIDGTGGIGLFSSNSFGYTVTEGDSVHVPGTIGQFNGLTQISPDTIILVSSGNPLKTPTTITALGEDTESEMIRFESAYLVDPADWPTTTGSVNFDITNGTDTITLRIDSDTDIDGTVGPPADTFNVTGIGGQFDGSSPYNDGYQMFPRYLTDFEADTAVGPPVFNLPIYPIDLVTNDNDGDGLGDSIGVMMELRGVVHGIDLSGGNSISFTIIDGTGGVGVFSSNNYGYTVTEGDSVHMPGTLSQFNGLTQLNPDTVVVISSGNALATPAVITALGESTESELIRFNDAYLVDPAQWPTTSGNANVDVTNGTDTILVRIDSDTDIDGTPAPTDTFDVIGIGGQFDSSSPYNDGYQLLPRYLPDFIVDTTGFNGLPVYPIALVTDDADGNGVGDSLNVACEVRGVVHGIDLQTSGSNVVFTIIDGTGGIGVASFGNTFGYTVLEGDSVHIPGTVDQFNGLTQMDPDTIILISGGNALATPSVITSLDETTESELIRFNNAFLVDPAQWPTATGSANVDITNGTDTILVRIDSDTDIDGTPAPTGLFDIIGLGGQFDSSDPYNDGYQLLPRYQPDIIPVAAPGFSFDPTAVLANEGDGTVSFSVLLDNAFPDTTTVLVSLNGGTATDGADFDMWMDTTLTFAPGAAPQSLSLNLIDDADVEATETIELVLSTPTGGPSLGDSVLTISIEDNDYPVYPIDILTADADGNGIGDSVGVSCEIRGVVYGIDMSGSASLIFTVIDATGGMGVFSGNDYGYMVTEGDSVHIPGTISEFRGLTQINPDTIHLISSGNALIEPAVVTTLDETTESEFIALECVRLIDVAAWPDSGNSATLQVTNGVDTLDLRVDNDTDIDGSPAPTSTWLNVIGIGGQFTFDDPPLDGYQILPRTRMDIMERPDPTVSFELATATVAEGDTTLQLIITQRDGNPDTTTVTVSLDASSTATLGDDFLFTNITVELSGCGADTVEVSLSVIADAIAEGDETVVLNLTEVGNNAMTDIGQYTLTIEDAMVDGIDRLSAENIQLFPNPTNGLVQLQSDYRMETIQVRNLLGQRLVSQSPLSFDSSLNLEVLPAGVYIVVVETAQGIWQQKVVKE